MHATQPPGTQIDILAVHNLRDLGGWPAGDGRRVRSGLIFHSTDLHAVADAGLEALARLGLRTIVDLRTVAEREPQPDRLPDGATQLYCDVLADARNAAPAMLPMIMADPRNAGELLGDGKAESLFAQGYRDIVSLPSALDAFRRYFLVLADETRRPLLFHCATGKDRTGWAAAATLSLLGVSQDDVFQDYMLTNLQLLPALQPVFDRFAAAGGDPDLLKPVLGVQPAYLEAAFEEMRRTFGSLDAYFEDGLKIESGTLRELRVALTEERTT
ncbi:Protein tyrosine/serine phosphatase [Martelella mediterranea DSM 17316]|uniref:Protein tyrosine/serine phosphatase n=2 Tax=Martelella mediterranea TaxID=293089 RepID=A0A1U9YZL4_9HYPH|nr:Protein tyrosine/serine phosphatase [Martelella mediterranea DSM 17316]